MTLPGEWVADALCAQTDPELFFPEQFSPRGAAAQICRRCPVSQECLEHALKHNEQFGVWGGHGPFERRRMRQGGSSTPSWHGTSGGVQRHYRERTVPCEDCRRAYNEKYRERYQQQQLRKGQAS